VDVAAIVLFVVELVARRSHVMSVTRESPLYGIGRGRETEVGKACHGSACTHAS
jgi:hypothetical protein